MPAEGPKRSVRERWLRAGVISGVLLVAIPFVLSLVNIGRVSGVPEGLRGATHHPELQHQVGIALGSAMAVALLAPPGVLLIVLCGVALAADKKEQRDARNDR
jgi:uncharacterized membrane protein YccF (DUF307 family)